MGSVLKPQFPPVLNGEACVPTSAALDRVGTRQTAALYRVHTAHNTAFPIHLAPPEFSFRGVWYVGASTGNCGVLYGGLAAGLCDNFPGKVVVRETGLKRKSKGSYSLIPLTGAVLLKIR